MGRNGCRAAGLAALLVTVAARQGWSQQVSAAEQAAVTDTIKARAGLFAQRLAPGKLGDFLALFANDADFIYVDGGNIYPTRAALGRAATGFFRSLKTGGGSWDKQQIVVLSPTAGSFTGVFRSAISDTTGKAIWTNGKVWTLVFQRRAGAWVIVQAHEATVPAPK